MTTLERDSTSVITRTSHSVPEISYPQTLQKMGRGKTVPERRQELLTTLNSALVASGARSTQAEQEVLRATRLVGDNLSPDEKAKLKTGVLRPYHIVAHRRAMAPIGRIPRAALDPKM